jgi:serine/threonine protein phosphatase PrpC
VKQCPRCGASADDDKMFCEADGVHLVVDASFAFGMETVPPPAVRGGVGCPSCGHRDVSAGESDRIAPCPSCGQLIGGDRITPPLVPLGARVGRGEVIAARGADDFIVRMPSGEELTFAIGTEQGLALEMEALAALSSRTSSLSRSSRSTFPRVLEHGDDARHGAFVALTPPPAGARRLVDEARMVVPARALDLLVSVLDIADEIERAGFDWMPDKNDVWIDTAGSIALSRLRIAEKLAGRARLDARALLEALGGAFVPHPAVLLTPEFLRLIVPHHGVDLDAHFDLDQARAALSSVRGGLALPVEDAPGVATLCDAGLRRDHNEDAVSVASGDGDGESDRWTALVVCDGVSASAHADRAAKEAARTACLALAEFARSGEPATDAARGAMTAAIRAAHLAVCATKIDQASDEPPGTTLVASLVHRGHLTVGWMGDSRAYWISKSRAALLTRDHSWANDVVARGEMTEAEAMRAPLAHALTKCLGPLDYGDDPIEIDPDVRDCDLSEPGTLVLCSDGLWNYFSQASAIADLVREAGEGAEATAVARLLVNHALVRGGQDNVTVAVLRVS